MEVRCGKDDTIVVAKDRAQWRYFVLACSVFGSATAVFVIRLLSHVDVICCDDRTSHE